MNFATDACYNLTIKKKRRSILYRQYNEWSRSIIASKNWFKFSSFASLKENVDVKIDAALKAMKCNGNATLASETKNKSRRYLEYEIDFQN